MALNPDEQESQIIVPPHSPPPEQDYLDNAFPGGADGYHNRTLNDEQNFDADDVQMIDVVSEAGEMILNTELMPRQYPSHNSQQDSHKSLVEETQFAEIERDTQAVRYEEESVQKDTQNASFGSRSLVEKTQFAAIEIDAQAVENTTQFDDTFPSFQKPHVPGSDVSAVNVALLTNMSPPRVFSRPTEPKEAPYRFPPAPSSRRNYGSTVQNASAPRVAAQRIQRSPKVLTKASRGPSANPVHHTQKANPGDNNASVIHPIPDVRVRPSVKPIREREVIPVIDVMPLSQHPFDTHNMSLTTSAQHLKSVPPPVFKASRHQQMSNVLPTPSDKPAPEQILPLTIQNTAINEYFSDTCNIPPPNSLHPPRGVSSVLRNKFQHHQILDSDPASTVKACGPKEAVRPITRNYPAIHPPIQKPTKRMAYPLLQREGIFSNPDDITPQSASHNEGAPFSKSNNMLVLKASHNEQSKLVGLPPPQQNAATSIHYAGRPRLRQKPSNQINRLGVSKIDVYGNLVKKAPFPEAFVGEPKLQAHREKSNKTQVPVPQPQYSEPRPGEKELPNQIEVATEPESQRLRTNDRLIQRGSMTQSVTNADPLSVSQVQVLDDRTEDSPVNPVEYEDDPQVEDSEEFDQSIPNPTFQPGHPVMQIDRHSPVNRKPSRTVTQANVSRTQTPRPQTTPRTQGGHEAQRKALNRPLKPHDLVPQGVSEVTSSHISVSKVTKLAAVHSEHEKNKTGDHVSSYQKKSSPDFGALHKTLAECQIQQDVIKNQENQIAILNAQLQDAEARLQDTNLINEELEASKAELSKRVERLNHLSNCYREHINNVVNCQKTLRQDSLNMKESMGKLEALKSQEIRNSDAQMKKMRRLLEEIKQVRKEQIERDTTIPLLEDLSKQNDQLRCENERLKADNDSKLIELEQERCYIEQLQSQINGDLDRHKEVMEILQKPQVDTLGELTKEDGILKKVLNSAESVNGKFEEMSKTFTSSFNQTLEWPQTLTKILEEFYSRIETKFDDNGSKDTNFQESTIKLFDDLKERLNQISGDMDEKTKLSEQINMLRESNATFKASLNSKEADLENNVARMDELTRELADAHSELMEKTQQLAISLAQPREDLELKRKVDGLTNETSRLEGLLTAANHDKRQTEKDIQAHQATIITTQKQLRDTEEKFRDVESNMQALEAEKHKFQRNCISTTERVRQETARVAMSQTKELLAQHDSLVNDLKHKQAETEKRLQTAIEKSKTFKEATDKHTKTISELESKIATYKDQFLQQKHQLQRLEESSISPDQFQKFEREHKQEILSIHREQASQLASSQACREEIRRIKDELEGAHRRLGGMNEENEHLTKENDRLRKRLEDMNTMTENTQDVIGNPHRVDDIQPISLNNNRSSSRRPAERRSGNFHSQPLEKGMGENQHRVCEFQTDEANKPFSRTLSSSQTYGDNRGGSQSPIKPFSTIATLATSPLTDLEDVMSIVQSAHSREDLDRVYSKNRQPSNDKIAQMESRPKYYPYGDEHLGTPKSKINKVMLTLEGEFVDTPSRASRTILSVAEESVQRRTNKPLKSALKKGDHQDYSIPHDASQDQVHNQDERLFKKPPLRKNHGSSIGLQATRGTGTGSYNRIASGEPKVASSRAPETRYKPTPEIKRNAIKRARSSSSLNTQGLQPTKPAKAPRINHRQSINKTIIPDSQ
ncbi:uncharacterized protein Bfra_011673 [Botrytis fragariae]|uniref:Uncharacterized protein n=1 Tax=Botrytis fragariae TaxID=1964551 RepID=A0A8H6EEN7_9HELO|nr:uncharacterized protein Bfra_011673 [Botrytis fragariae]KAF5869130.1 hypothetical protein Bfra_011673 [Botrytis fragariae]